MQKRTRVEGGEGASRCQPIPAPGGYWGNEDLREFARPYAGQPSTALPKRVEPGERLLSLGHVERGVHRSVGRSGARAAVTVGHASRPDTAQARQAWPSGRSRLASKSSRAGRRVRQAATEFRAQRALQAPAPHREWSSISTLDGQNARRLCSLLRSRQRRPLCATEGLSIHPRDAARVEAVLYRTANKREHGDLRE